MIFQESSRGWKGSAGKGNLYPPDLYAPVDFNRQGLILQHDFAVVHSSGSVNPVRRERPVSSIAQILDKAVRGMYNWTAESVD